MNLIRKILLLILLLSFTPALSLFALPALSEVEGNTVAFYFSAHEDDWQLFMNPNAYRDVQRPSTKVVFVYLAAGDGGAGLGNAGRAHPYYLARENGAKLSVKFIADANNTPVASVDSYASVSGHKIKTFHYRNTVSYFFRLPDGNIEGTGYKTTGFQSLKRFHEGAVPAMTAIDNSATYKGWPDLTKTLRKLIDLERGNAENVWVNIPDTNLEKNIGDHTDHQHMAQAVLEAVEDLPCVNKAFYLNYVTADLPENMTAAEQQIEAGTFAALTVGLTELDHPSPWEPMHRSWLSRHYFSTELSKKRINTYAQELISMTRRAEKYTDPNTMAFVIFEKDDIFIQVTTFEPDTTVIDLPVNIMRDDRAEILCEIFPKVHKNYEFKPNGAGKLVSYQIYFDNTDIDIRKAAAAIDIIFLKVFGLKSDYSEIKIKTETD